jgi:putative copper export protein
MSTLWYWPDWRPGFAARLVWQVRKAATLDHAQLLSLVRRFSYLASFSVFALAITGLFNSLVELPAFRPVHRPMPRAVANCS